MNQELEKIIETTRYRLTPKECLSCEFYIKCDKVKLPDGSLAKIAVPTDRVLTKKHLTDARGGDLTVNHIKEVW